MSMKGHDGGQDGGQVDRMVWKVSVASGREECVTVIVSYYQGHTPRQVVTSINTSRQHQWPVMLTPDSGPLNSALTRTFSPAVTGNNRLLTSNN